MKGGRVSSLRYNRYLMKSFRNVLLLLAIGLAICWQSADGPQSAFASRQDSALQKLHLWRALPTSAFVRLGGGSRRRSRWEAFAFRNPSATTPDRVCVQVISAHLREPFGVVTVSFGSPTCGRVGPSTKTPIVFQVDSQEVPRSLIGVITGIDSSEVRVAVNPGTELTERVRVVGPSRSAKGRVSPFRYALLASRQQVCVEQVLGEDHGLVDFETPAAPCSDHGP
jgi:hypothetical protein